MILDLERVAAMFDGRRPIVVGAPAAGRACSPSAKAISRRRRSCSSTSRPASNQRARCACSRSRQQPDGFGSLDEAANAIRHYRPHPPQALSEESLARSLRYDDGKYRWHWDPHFLAWPRATRRHARAAASARRLTLPTLFLRGAASDIVSEAGAREFLSLCPHAEHTEVRNASHTVAGEHNGLFVHAVLDFLERRIPPDRAQHHAAA